MKVIDISGWSENLDWNAIAQSEDGVIIKVSEGRTVDSSFRKNLNDVLATQMRWGVYCVSHAQTTERAEEEAEVVCDILSNIGQPNLGIWFDMEPFMVDAVDAEDLTAIASAFVSSCNASGYECGIYGNYTALNKLNAYDLADYVPYWSAEPGSYQCDFKAENPSLRVIGWQYEFDSNKYGGVCDLNEWWEND